MKVTTDTVQRLFQHPQNIISLRIPSCDRFITLTKRGLQRVWYSASSFKFQYLLFALWQSSRFKSSSSSFLFSVFSSKTFQNVNNISNHCKLFHFFIIYRLWCINANSSSSNYVSHSGWMIGEQLAEDLKGISRNLCYLNPPNSRVGFEEKNKFPRSR